MSDTAQIIKLADGLFVRQEVDNLTWADMGEYAVVVDALEQPHLEREVFDAIRSTIGEKQISYVLNTHMHYDHVALHPAFIGRGAQIVVQKRGVRENEPNFITFADSWEHSGTKRAVSMHWLGGCHTAEDSVIYFPDDGVLCIGDLFSWGLITGNPNRAGLKDALLDRYEKMIAFNARVVVPGHGPLATTDHLRRWVAYYAELSEAVAEKKRAGRTVDEVKRELPPPVDMREWWRFVEWKHDTNTARVYASL